MADRKRCRRIQRAGFRTGAGLDSKGRCRGLECQALEAIGIEHREALVLRFKEEMTLQEIANALEISLSAAKMRISRGLARIRQILSDNGQGPGE